MPGKTEIQEIVEKLKAGNERFVNDRPDHPFQDRKRRDALKAGQRPHTVVLSCSDSRVVPEFVFDAGLGELFVIRIAGNTATRETIASIEFAVGELGSKVILVMGHEACGAVTAAVGEDDPDGRLGELVTEIRSSLDLSRGHTDPDGAARANVGRTVEELGSKSRLISSKLGSGDISVFPAFYYLSGSVEFPLECSRSQ